MTLHLSIAASALALAAACGTPQHTFPGAYRDPWTTLEVVNDRGPGVQTYGQAGKNQIAVLGLDGIDLYGYDATAQRSIARALWLFTRTQCPPGREASVDSGSALWHLVRAPGDWTFETGIRIDRKTTYVLLGKKAGAVGSKAAVQANGGEAVQIGIATVGGQPLYRSGVVGK